MKRAAFLLASIALAGCGKGDGPAGAASAAAKGSAAPGASAARAESVVVNGVPIGIPGSPDKVVAVVNPDKRAPYSGPVGTLRGTVRIEGDAAPDIDLKPPANCKEARATYGKLFRVGIDKALADAMVAVTGYGKRGFVPATSDVAKVTIHGCATARRTYALTYGQRIEVSNLDKVDSYLPFLDGAPTKAVMVAVPGGAPIKLYPMEASAHYMIRDEMPSKLVADVFVLSYATVGVTGLDGQYEIKGIPVGEVKVSAFLPVIDKAEEKPFEVKEGDNTLDITLHFDAKKDIPGAKPSPSGSASASAPPAPSGEPLPKPPR